MDWQLGMLIGVTFIQICDELKEKGREHLIPEFSAGLSFMNKQNLPVKIMVLYLQEYMKKGEI